MSNEADKNKIKAEIDVPITMGIPFSTDHMLSIQRPGSDSANQTYVPDQDILNCVPGAFSGMCQLIQTLDIDAAQDKLGISDDEMLKAVQGMRYMLSNSAPEHATVVDAYRNSGLLDVSWQARTWVLKNLGDMMLRMWFESAKARITNTRHYHDYYVNQAADLVAKSIRDAKT
tara:strand:+ start:425 stop:943 length:519 start_codon:yes stop_codon:yes gene_type:complete